MKSYPHIILKCPEFSPRLRFVCNFIETSCECRITLMKQNESMAMEYTDRGPFVIHYSDDAIENEFCIFHSGFLNENNIRVFRPQVQKKDNSAFLFSTGKTGFSMAFDLFSAIFYLLSRYEEYIPFVPDRHERFEANQSLAWEHNFIEDPVIDQWLILFKNLLKEKYPAISFKKQHYRYNATFDIDNPTAYLFKNPFRNFAGKIKDLLKLDFYHYNLRTNVLKRKIADPFITYSCISDAEKKYGFRSQFFFLCGGYGGNDTNYLLKHPYFIKLVNDLKTDHTYGIHPSWKSHYYPELLEKEHTYFRTYLQSEPKHSRQHFLMLRFPDTYRQLINIGVQHDYSMGYASAPGFRAGTSLPFKFYDLEKEKEEELIIHPFVIMDVTLQQYLNLTPAEAKKKISEIIEKIKLVKGIFTSLWHNESLSDEGIWKGWRDVFEDMVRMASQLKNTK